MHFAFVYPLEFICYDRLLVKLKERNFLSNCIDVIDQNTYYTSSTSERKRLKQKYQLKYTCYRKHCSADNDRTLHFDTIKISENLCTPQSLSGVMVLKSHDRGLNADQMQSSKEWNALILFCSNNCRTSTYDQNSLVFLVCVQLRSTAFSDPG